VDNLTILVVEDDPTMSKLLTGMLFKAGANNVEQCNTVASARAAYDQSHYQIVMLDLGLPDGNGQDLMEEFRGQRSGQHIVLVTADDSIESIQRAISSGANGYVVKPYSQEKIDDVINNFMLVHGSSLSSSSGMSGLH